MTNRVEDVDPGADSQAGVGEGAAQPGSQVRVVLVHGTRFEAGSWAPYAALLPGVEIVAVDLPGHGTRRDTPYTTEAALAVLGEAVSGPSAASGPNGTIAGGAPQVVLVGASLGGYVATSYAQAHPDRLAALVLIGATADPARHPRLRRIYTGFARLLPVVGAARMATVANGVMRWLGAAPELLPDESGYAATPAAWAAVMGEARAEQLAEVGCPIYLVSGQFDQLGIDRAAYASAARRSPSVATRVVPRTTHLLPLTHPEPVAAVIHEAVIAASSRPPPAPAQQGTHDRCDR